MAEQLVEVVNCEMSGMSITVSTPSPHLLFAPTKWHASGFLHVHTHFFNLQHTNIFLTILYVQNVLI